MTSPEAKRLWRRAIKEHFDCTCIYCGETHDINDLTLITSILAILAVKMTPTTSYAPAYVVIRKRERITGNSSYNNMEIP